MRKIKIKVTTVMDNIELLKQNKVRFAVSAISESMVFKDPNFFLMKERVEKVSFEFAERAPDIDFMSILKQLKGSL